MGSWTNAQPSPRKSNLGTKPRKHTGFPYPPLSTSGFKWDFKALFSGYPRISHVFQQVIENHYSSLLVEPQTFEMYTAWQAGQGSWALRGHVPAICCPASYQPSALSAAEEPWAWQAYAGQRQLQLWLQNSCSHGVLAAEGGREVSYCIVLKFLALRYEFFLHLGDPENFRDRDKGYSLWFPIHQSHSDYALLLWGVSDTQREN